MVANEKIWKKMPESLRSINCRSKQRILWIYPKKEDQFPHHTKSTRVSIFAETSDETGYEERDNSAERWARTSVDCP